MASAATHNGTLHIPTIDITPYLDGDPGKVPDATARVAVARRVDQAARTVGFMQIVGHGIPPATLQAFLREFDDFFALDLDAKKRYQCPPQINRGYSPPKSEALANSLGLATAADLFEAFNLGVSADEHPELALPADAYAPNIHPTQLPGFATAVDGWFREAGRVARVMTRIFADALGLCADYFTQHTDHSIDVLRLNNYRLPAADTQLEPDQVGMGAHTDYGIVTILWADQVPGLEILGTDTTWHPVQPAPGALLVNLGDAMARWTNDQWLSTMHRVAPPRIHGHLVPRRSAAYFHDGNIDAVIACLATCTGPGTPAAYAPITVGEHLEQKLAGSRNGILNPYATREASRLRGAETGSSAPVASGFQCPTASP